MPKILFRPNLRLCKIKIEFNLGFLRKIRYHLKLMKNVYIKVIYFKKNVTIITSKNIFINKCLLNKTKVVFKLKQKKINSN